MYEGSHSEKITDSGTLAEKLWAGDIEIIFTGRFDNRPIRVLRGKFGEKFIQEGVTQRGPADGEEYVLAWKPVELDSVKYKEIICAALASKF